MQSFVRAEDAEIGQGGTPWLAGAESSAVGLVFGELVLDWFSRRKTRGHRFNVPSRKIAANHLASKLKLLTHHA